MLQHVSAVWKCRHFWLSLVRMDLRQRYRRSVLGLGWSLLNPLAMTAVFCLVFSNLMGNANWRDYAPYLLAGMSVWEFIRNSATLGCQTFIQNESYIRQCPLPYAIYPLRTVLGAAIHFLISLVVVVFLIAALQQSTAVFAVAWSVIPAVLLVGLFSWGVATLFGFATVYFHDLKHLVEVGSQLWFFITPIMYQRKMLDDKGVGWLADLNPVNLFIELIRTPLVEPGHPLPETGLYVQAVVLTAAVVGLAFGTIAWLQKKLIFQL
jgi:lipopolysaccharide transport system permease protein